MAVLLQAYRSNGSQKSESTKGESESGWLRDGVRVKRDLVQKQNHSRITEILRVSGTRKCTTTGSSTMEPWNRTQYTIAIAL